MWEHVLFLNLGKNALSIFPPQIPLPTITLTVKRRTAELTPEKENQNKENTKTTQVYIQNCVLL